MKIPINPNFNPAFPVDASAPVWSFGLSKREYFAACAMQGILANEPDCSADAAAHDAVAAADALIAALDRVAP